MTQERKDELYDAMIAWICEHIQSDTELFNVLHGEFVMTKDELHDHCIESLDYLFPENKVQNLLKAKLEQNLSDYREKWLQMSPTDLISQSDEITVMTRLVSILPGMASDEEAEYLLEFVNPLQVVGEEFLSQSEFEPETDGERIGHLLWSLLDKRDADMVYEKEVGFDPGLEEQTMSF